MPLTMYIPYEKFLPEVLPYVRDVSDAAALAAIKSACIQFCQESGWLRDEQEGMEIVPGEAEYEMDPPLGYTVATILSASIGSYELRPTAPEELVRLYGAGWRMRSGAVRHFMQDTINTLRLVLVPQEEYDDQLNVVVSVRPTQDSTRIDLEIYERWAEAISFGARARLYDTPGQPYYNEAQAARFRTWFATQIADATGEAQRGRTRGPLRVRYRDFV